MATRDRRIPGGRITHVVFAVLALVGLTTALEGSAPGPAALVAFAQEGVTSVPKAEGCLACHQGIEDMHPWLALSCVDCHGGDASAKSKHDAHVHSMGTRDDDERVQPLDQDLAWRRFVNPTDLRVVKGTCGTCHESLCNDLELSLHGTTAGHLSDGFYEMGLSKERGSLYGVFPVASHKTDKGAVDSLVQPPSFTATGAADGNELGRHFTDLVRKECMQCHLYSRGRALRGRVGWDGDYRSEGCAACHVKYARNGLSDSADRSVSRTEPGHPWRHQMTSAPTTETCTSCHYGDASIGLHFRGLSQLPPGAPGGPEIEGTTDSPLNRAFYLNDNRLAPPDIHHESGMHCIDCHTLTDVMGDGALHGQMEHAVEISCEGCHGSFTERATLKTERGTRLEHMNFVGKAVYLTSKVTGRKHRVKQVVDVLDAKHRDHNPAAAKAMTGAHGKLECYTCHASWNVNFLGFHFYRNEALSQQDLVSGRRTPGRVTTQEKVFTTWRSFYAGLNETGRVAPYLTGFSTMGTVDDADGNRVLDQHMPVTAAGLSGMTMVHHQLHSTRATARGCVECHRSSSTWGLGSSNFRLARHMAFIADRRGIEAVAMNRANLASSVPLGKFVLPDIVDMELDCESLQGHARTLYVAEGGRGVHVLDVSDPTAPKRLAFTMTASPRGLARFGDHLAVADGVGGLLIYDVSKPSEIKLVGVAPTLDAHDVEIRWPYAYVADGPGGLAIVDVREPIRPKVVGGLDWKVDKDNTTEAVSVEVLFQYSRPQVLGDAPAPFRKPGRHVAALLDRNLGAVLIDVTEPTRPKLLSPKSDTGRSGARRVRDDVVYTGLSMRSKVDLATPQGGEPTAERDYVYVVAERTLGNGDQRSNVFSVDITEPESPKVANFALSGDQSEMLVHASFYNPPFLQPVSFVPGNAGVFLTDLSNSTELESLGALQGLRNGYVVVLEEFPLDRMVDETGRRLKDVSHEGSRWLYRAEISRILDVPGDLLGLFGKDDPLPNMPAASARAFLARHDKDRDGTLRGDELDDLAGLDVDGDGRATLIEIAGLATPPRERTESEQQEGPILTRRTDQDGDLARLLDGIDPLDYDRDDDRRLNRREMARAMYDALDLDRDGKLTIDELSRHPGLTRRLRYGDRSALGPMGAKKRGDIAFSGFRNFNVQEPEWLALDRNGDDGVQLQPDPTDMGRRDGLPPPVVEWPSRQQFRIPLPASMTAEDLLERLDKDGDGDLSLRELKKRPDLLRLDPNYDGVLTGAELGRLANLVVGGGVEVLVDDFTQRWDWNGDGVVGEGELPAFARTAVDARR
tara:strand:+ start:15704 stop:19630 length:3927 start_codon:yes stop_codon:yes gene_type:complete